MESLRELLRDEIPDYMMDSAIEKICNFINKNYKPIKTKKNPLCPTCGNETSLIVLGIDEHGWYCYTCKKRI